MKNKGNKGKKKQSPENKKQEEVVLEDMEHKEENTAPPETTEVEETIRTEPQQEAEAQSGDESLNTQLQAEKDRYMRLYAEYDNFRKRSQKEREAFFNDVRGETVSKFLPVYDNLLRALDQETTDEAYKKGIEMIFNQLWEVMEKIGVSEIPALGETFDPELHNAVMHIEDEAKGEGEIVEEFAKGFKVGDKVIRFSMVKVAN